VSAAGAKRARVRRGPQHGHRCKCGEADPSKFHVNSWRCKACKQAEYRAVYRVTTGGKPGRKRGMVAHLFCPCGREFALLKRTYLNRVAQKHKRDGANDTLYCSKTCGRMLSEHRHENGLHLLKRKPWWSDERWKWERILTGEGLGVGRGADTKRLLYGLHNYIWDGTKIVAKRQQQMWED
jgi:hypothetical protein